MARPPISSARLSPRENQLAAIDAVCAEFEVADRATVVKACGTGKTLLEQEIDARMGARYTLVLAPTLGLLSQTIQTWLRQYAKRNGCYFPYISKSKYLASILRYVPSLSNSAIAPFNASRSWGSDLRTPAASPSPMIFAS